MKKLVTAFLWVCFNGVFAQTVLWSEDFSDESDGATTGTAVGGTWSVTTSPAAGIFSRNTQLLVTGFYVNNTATEGVWQSDHFSIGLTGMATISIQLATLLTDPSDYLRAYYKVDGSSTEILFAELDGSLLGSSTVNESAIISGNTVQIVVRGIERTSGSTSWFRFTNVIATSVPVLYSCASANWNVASTWSTIDFAGPCNASVPPSASQVALIGGGRTVNLTADAAVGGVDIRNTGTLRYMTADVDLGIENGLVRVRSGGSLTSNGQANAQIDFNQNAGGATLHVDAGGSVVIEDVTFDDNAGSTHHFTGGGTLNITDDILFLVDNTTLTNNMSGTVTIADRIEYASGTNNVSFTNNGTLTATTLFFDDDNNTFTNANTATFSGNLTVNGTADDNNIINNSSGAILSFVSLDGDATTTGGTDDGGDMTVNNSGTLRQSGNFFDVNVNGNLNNLNGAVWNWSLTPNTGFDPDLLNILNLGGGVNTIEYGGAGNQTILPITYRSLILSNSGTKSTTVGGTITVTQNLSIRNAAILDMAADLVLGGNWDAAGASSSMQGTQTVTLNGSGTQTITNPSGEIFYNLILNLGAAANTVQLANAITVSNVLTLTRGGLNLNGNQLTLSNSASSAMTATTDGYVISEVTSLPYSPVIWNMGTTVASYTFPFRDAAGGNSIPVVFNKTTTGAGAGSFGVSTYHTAANNTPRPSGVNHTKNDAGNDISSLVADRFWVITPSGYSTVPTATVTFNITGSEQVTGQNLVAQRWNGTSWDSPLGGQSSSLTSATVTIPGTFSPWALSANVAPLPIKLTGFDAVQQDDQVVLYWTTATELNNDFFTVERLNKKDAFDEVTRVAGKGTTKEPANYETVDTDPHEGKNYYRLKQTDFDGLVSYSQIVMADFKAPEESFRLYPNPTHNEDVTIELRNMPPQQQATLEISNLLGMKAVQRQLKADDNGRIKTTITNGALPRGVYIVNVSAGTSMKRKMIIE